MLFSHKSSEMLLSFNVDVTTKQSKQDWQINPSAQRMGLHASACLLIPEVQNTANHADLK